MRTNAKSSIFPLLLLVLTFAVSGGRTQYFHKAPEILLEGDQIVMENEAKLNLTCRGKHPVAWSTNHFVHYDDYTEVIDEGHDKPHVASFVINKVNYTHVGYYFCLWNTTENKQISEWDPDEPLVSAVYVYVRDEQHLLTDDTRKIFFTAEVNQHFTLPCKPTFPEVRVTLDKMQGTFDPRRGFTFVPDPDSIDMLCQGSYKGKNEWRDMILSLITKGWSPNKPVVEVKNALRNILVEESEHYTVVEGSNVSLICTYNKNFGDSNVIIVWEIPEHANNDTGNHLIFRDSKEKMVQRTHTIINVDPLTESGEYKCFSKLHDSVSEPYAIKLNVVDRDAVNVDLKADDPNIEVDGETPLDSISWLVEYHAYPPPVFIWRKDGEILVNSSQQNRGDKRYKLDQLANQCLLLINNPILMDIGQYTFQGIIYSTDFQILESETINLSFLMKVAPNAIQISLSKVKPMYTVNESFHLVCEATGYPKPVIDLYVKQCFERNNCSDYAIFSTEQNHKYGNPNELKLEPSANQINVIEKLEWYGRARAPGYFQCKARNEKGDSLSEELSFLVTDGSKLKNLTIEAEVEGVMINKRDLEVLEGDTVVLRCRENKMSATGIPHWISYSEDGYRNVTPKEHESPLSYISELWPLTTVEHMNWITFTCVDSDTPRVNITKRIKVSPMVSPTWKEGDPGKLTDRSLNEMGNLTISCQAGGAPKPTVTWYKNDKLLTYLENGEITGDKIVFKFLLTSDSGHYRCEVVNRAGTISREAYLEVTDPDAQTSMYVIIVVAIFVICLLICISWFCVKLYKDRKRTKILRLEDHRMFVAGDPERINPDLGLDQQAELLPYDTKYEIPREAIIFEKLLGSGAFGRVYQATVLNLLPGQARTTVAVKMMKSRTDHAQLKALRSEVKIMIHIGRHINIVNLLGACAKELATKGELLLLVEYCKHGNILDYMRRHRNEFVNQINDQDKIDPTFKAYRMRQRSGSGSRMRNSRGLKYAHLSFNRDVASYTVGTSDEGSAQALWVSPEAVAGPSNIIPERRSRIPSTSSNHFAASDMTYESSNGGSDCYISPQGTGSMSYPLCSKDLLCWAFQIAKGMEYLAFKKVLHGDLAARNVLLAEGNIVKISDFGFAKDIYKNDNYRKKTSGPVPVKWLALECFRDGVFSTQSDVWSFGVVLWEIFTLGRDPYPGVEFDESFPKKLEKGVRLEQPSYSTYDIYCIMQACWEADPRSRPTFTNLEVKLGELLGETEKQHYLELNEPYQAENVPSEYLSRIQSPDYSSIVRGVTPNLDEDGYEMPFSPSPCVPMALPPLNCGTPRHTSRQISFLSYADCPQQDSSGSYLPMSSPSRQSQMMFDFGTEAVTYIANKESESLTLQESEDGEDCEEEKDNYLVMANNEEDRSTEANGQVGSSAVALRNKLVRRTSDIDKHDSGLYSPTAYLQNNPNYMIMGNVPTTDEGNYLTKEDAFALKEKEKRQDPHYMNYDEIGKAPSEHSKSEYSSPKYINYNPTGESRHRTLSEASSGLGSISGESSNQSRVDPDSLRSLSMEPAILEEPVAA